MNIALIGLGMVADTHVNAVKAADGLSIVGVLGRDPARRGRLRTAMRCPFIPISRRCVLMHRWILCCLTTPPDARAPLVERLIAAGKPILMEKPIERDLSSARRIVAACDRANLPMGVMFQHRTRTAATALRTAIDAGSLGEIATVDLRVPWWRDQSYYDVPGRGSLPATAVGYDLAGHSHPRSGALASGPDHLGSSMTRTTALHRLEAEDWAGALFEMDCGAVGSLMATTAAFPGHAESITVQGTRAAAHLSGGVLTLTHLDGHLDRIGATAASGGGADPMAFTHEWHQRAIEDFADALRHGRPPIASGQSALARMRSSTRCSAPATPSADRGGTMTLGCVAIGIDHRHIFGMIAQMQRVGVRCLGFWTDGTPPTLPGS
ncbi:Gfo/Idh/MocA family protein [Sulfitobacter albidus]|uniref:Gfo/Idh/MocA family protein n=1 Tax=Sulfitobacter albidus TaxID=2829501 RepID=UPI0020C88B51|nr:Gfo/Idh/MocA family oxidoreductase [Sulfitobacter albidus]